jgi:hypothetical protein
MANQSFVFYKSFADALLDMDPEECKACIASLCRYAFDGEEEAETPMAKVFLTLVKPQIDANIQRREAGRSGGTAKASKSVAKSSDATKSAKQIVVNPSDATEDAKQSLANVNVNVNANANVKENPPTPFTVLRAGAEELEELGLTQEVAQPMSDWIAIRREGKRPITETSFKYAVSRAKEAVQKYGGERVAALIRDSVASGYDGIPWDRLKEQRASPQRPKGWDFEQKADYDMSELENRLLAN